MKVELIPLSRAAGRELWTATFPDCDFPSAKYFEVRRGTATVGWCACRYLPARVGREAVLVSEGAYVKPACRGQGLQNEIRKLMVDRHRAPGSKRKIMVRTYVNATNVPSLRNCVKAGLLPFKFLRQGADVFVHLQGKL